MTSHGLSVITSVYMGGKHLENYFWNVSQVAVPDDCEILVAIVGPDSDRDFQRASVLGLGSHPAVRVIRIMDRQNLPATWNRLVREATYDNVSIWNVDDSRSPDSLMSTLNNVQNHDYSIAYGSFLIESIRRGRRVQRNVAAPWPIKAAELRGMPFGPFMTFSKTAFEAVGGFDEQYSIAADFDFGLRAAFVAPVVRIDTLLGSFSDHGNGLSTRSPGMLLTERTAVQLRHGHFDHLNSFYLRAALHYMPEHILRGAEWISLAKLDPVFWHERAQRIHAAPSGNRLGETIRSLLGRLEDFRRL